MDGKPIDTEGAVAAPADKPEVAVSALVVNTPAWQIKAPQLARDSLRAYFAKAGRKGVSAP